MRRTVTAILFTIGLAGGAVALGACGSSSKSTPSNQPGVTTNGGIPAPTAATPTTASAPSGGGGYGYG